MDQQSHPMLTFFTVGGVDGLGGSMRRKYIKDGPCLSCGRIVSEQSYENSTMEVGGGTASRWPDIFPSMGDVAIVHERVVNKMNDEGFTGVLAYPVEFTKITQRKLKVGTAPQYYLLEPIGSISLDLAEYGTEKDGHVCPECLNWQEAPNAKPTWARPHRYVPDLATWDGSDFVKIRNLKLHWTLCTRRFIDFAGRHKFADFRFGQLLSHVKINHLQSDWFEEASAKIKTKYFDLFGLGEEDMKPPAVLPSPVETPVPLKKLSESEEYEKEVNELQNPRFDLLEAYFKHPIAHSLRELYQDHEELVRWRFVVEIALSDEVLEQASISELAVESYSHINGKTMETCGPEMESFIEFASDGIGGYYCVDPRESDPEVHVFIADGGDLVPLEISLSEFLKAPRIQQDIA